MILPALLDGGERSATRRLPVTAVLGQALPLAKGVGRLSGDLLRVVAGTDAHLPHPKDRRFSDVTWTENPLFRRLAQGYVALGDSLAAAVDALEDTGLQWRDVERLRFLNGVVTSALAPTNNLFTNPAALKLALETGGGSVRRGLRNLVSDLGSSGLPAQVDRSGFVVGTDLALTPGSVVQRDEMAELLHYAPSTPQVHARPVVIVPPPIGRYYFLDLRPGRSFVEHAVAQGLQVFLVSWRNPGPEQASWDVDAYCGRVLSALAAVKEITGSDSVNTLGFCAGGIVQTGVLNHLAAVGASDTVESASYAVTLLDFDSPAPLGAFSFPPLLRLASLGSRHKGVLSAAALGAVFSLMRPDDLVFNYLVDGWLMGKEPPAFDILAWSADGTNLPAALHAEFLDVLEHNKFIEPSDLRVLGHQLDLSRVSQPTFVTGAVNDHLTPWAGCYRTTELLPGESVFVLSNAGHIASLVNPPGNPKASYLTGGQQGEGAQAWRETATTVQGSWWTAWTKWVVARSGPLQDAVAPGSCPGHPALEAAPGSYVVDREVPAAQTAARTEPTA